MKEENEELIHFTNLEKAKNLIIDRLKYDFRSGAYTCDGYDYKKRIEKLVRDFSINRTGKLRVDAVITKIDEFSGEVLIISTGVNDKFIFNARVWIREDKLRKLI